MRLMRGGRLLPRACRDRRRRALLALILAVQPMVTLEALRCVTAHPRPVVPLPRIG
jgi:hypothetical protein